LKEREKKKRGRELRASPYYTRFNPERGKRALCSRLKSTGLSSDGARGEKGHLDGVLLQFHKQKKKKKKKESTHCTENTLP